MTKEYADRYDRPLREEYRDLEEQPMRVVVGPMPWSDGQQV